MKIAILLIFLFPFTSYGGECNVTGDAILWAYDSCLWAHETDDSIHPGVIKCVEKAQKEIAQFGECQSKRIFKKRICNLAKQWKLEVPNPQTCMAIDQALGAAVRTGGI